MLWVVFEFNVNSNMFDVGLFKWWIGNMCWLIWLCSICIVNWVLCLFKNEWWINKFDGLLIVM